MLRFYREVYLRLNFSLSLGRFLGSGEEVSNLFLIRPLMLRKVVFWEIACVHASCSGDCVCVRERERARKRKSHSIMTIEPPGKSVVLELILDTEHRLHMFKMYFFTSKRQKVSELLNWKCFCLR